MEKRCGKCKITKPVDSFYRGNKTKDGYQAMCKICCADDAKIRKRKKMKEIGDTRNFNTLFRYLSKEEWCQMYLVLSRLGYNVNEDIHLQFIERHPQLVYKSQTEVLKNRCLPSDCKKNPKLIKEWDSEDYDFDSID